jgi:hypothetical protein
MQDILQLKPPSIGAPKDPQYMNTTIMHPLKHTRRLNASAFDAEISIFNEFTTSQPNVDWPLPASADTADSFVVTVTVTATAAAAPPPAAGTRGPPSSAADPAPPSAAGPSQRQQRAPAPTPSTVTATVPPAQPAVVRSTTFLTVPFANGTVLTTPPCTAGTAPAATTSTMTVVPAPAPSLHPYPAGAPAAGRAPGWGRIVGLAVGVVLAGPVAVWFV